MSTTFAETTGDGPTRSQRFFGRRYAANSGPRNVMLLPLRISSLGRLVQPATMIGFKQTGFFDHTRCAPIRLCESKSQVGNRQAVDIYLPSLSPLDRMTSR